MTMVIIFAGISGSHVDHCAELAGELLAPTFPALRHLDLDDPAALDDLLTVAPEAMAIAVSRRPTGALIESLSARRYPIIYVESDPRLCVSKLAEAKGLPFEQSLREVAASCAALAGLLQPQNENLLRYSDCAAGQPPTREGLGRPISRLVPEIRAKVLSETSTRDVVRSHGPTGAARPALRSVKPDMLSKVKTRKAHIEAEWQQGLSETERRLINAVLGGYIPILEGGSLGEIRWPRELFFLGASPKERATKPVEISGASRCLIFGPNVPLPSGTWLATFGLAVSEEATKDTFAIEAYGVPGGPRAAVTPDKSGFFSVDIRLSIENATRPIEFDLINEKASFAGLVSLGGVILTRLADTPEEISNDPIAAQSSFAVGLPVVPTRDLLIYRPSDAHVIAGAIVRGTEPMVVETSPQIWGYAVMLPLRKPTAAETTRYCIKVALRVIHGQFGIAIGHKGDQSIAEQHFVSADDKIHIVELTTPEIRDCGSLIVRCGDQPSSIGEVRIVEISILNPTEAREASPIAVEARRTGSR